MQLLGVIPDILIQIVVCGEVTDIPALLRVNKETSYTIKAFEVHICRFILRTHDKVSMNPILVVSPYTGKLHDVLTFKSLVRFLPRSLISEELAQHLMVSTCRTDNTSNLKDALFFEKLLEISILDGLYVLWHMVDIAKDVDIRWRRNEIQPTAQTCARLRQRPPETQETLYKIYREFISPKLCAYSRLFRPTIGTSFDHWWAYHDTIAETRLNFRRYIGQIRDVNLQVALRTLRQLLRKMFRRHEPTDWFGDPIGEFSVIHWFLLRQSPESMQELILGKGNCCISGNKSSRSEPCPFIEAVQDCLKAWRGQGLPGNIMYRSLNVHSVIMGRTRGVHQMKLKILMYLLHQKQDQAYPRRLKINRGNRSTSY